MTEGSAHDADSTQMPGKSDIRRASKRRTETSNSDSDAVLDGGRIEASPSPVQIIMAVAALVLVAVISFATVFVVGTLFVGNRVTYWMIELIFALLCGGAGALLGGSAVVRSTLRIPGSPVRATVGGAVAMVIVGFALAYLGQPPLDEPLYALDIHGVPDRQTVGSDEYRVFVGANNSDITFSRDPDNVSLKIPPRVGTHKLLIAVYRPVGKDVSRTFARCELSFEIIAGERNGPTPMDLLSVESSPQPHLYFSQHYIEQTVTAALQRNELVADEACVEGRVATKSDKTPLDGHFTLQTNSVRSRALNFARFSPLPRYSVLARDRANSEPLDTQPDLPPQARPVPGHAKVSSAASPPEPPPSASALTQVAQAGGPVPKTAASSAESRAEQRAPAPPAPASVSAPGATTTPAVHSEPKTTSATDSGSLNEQVDAYVRGEDRDRTQLYQSWGQVADYVVKGLRDESAKGSALVAPYLNLLSNALGVIDDGKYLPPTLRPNWDQSVKPDRLSNKRNIPGFRFDDYRIVVESLCSSDEDVRRAAQRLLKLYPSDHFHPILQALPLQPNFNRCRIDFTAETAAYYFYNRIVEYDGIFALDKASHDWISQNYAEGTEWAKRGEAEGGSQPLFSAMLDYARGLVLLDHGERKDALASFNLMIGAIRSSGRIYPSNPRHIATALRLTLDPGSSAKTLQGASAVTPPERRPVAKAYIVADGNVQLFAVPDNSAKPFGKMKSDVIANVYLRAGNWDLVEGGNQIGWARRLVTSAAR
ncbi:hypothetical protein [Bradyrhizobium sp. Leo170]|uniref:hypothetical protein n=1 Tax=Bradyrhizobium sp. Leo170 TaxID=1571199 RepID=UPI00102E7C50|nr:hypothetical protein [Bradyrhizobium sp. Leo170]TAI65309.1 hypothetical protein CWO89_14230 [Bradyrhizobium sp. Leo170]